MTELDTLCCDICGYNFDEKTLEVINNYEPVVCPSCYRKYREYYREAWKQEQVEIARKLPNSEIRAHVRECLNVPTVYVPPVKSERSVSKRGTFGDEDEDSGSRSHRRRQLV